MQIDRIHIVTEDFETERRRARLEMQQTGNAVLIFWLCYGVFIVGVIYKLFSWIMKVKR